MVLVERLSSFNPTFRVPEFSAVSDNLVQWGACNQNFSTLGLILNTTSRQANLTVWNCGEELNTSLLLSLARTSLIYQLLASMFFSEMFLVSAVNKDGHLYVREHASKTYSSVSWILYWVSCIRQISLH